MEAEKGAAELNVRLDQGELVVRHTDRSGPVLLRGPLPAGGWDEIVSALLRVSPQAVGPMKGVPWGEPL